MKHFYGQGAIFLRTGLTMICENVTTPLGYFEDYVHESNGHFYCFPLVFEVLYTFFWNSLQAFNY